MDESPAEAVHMGEHREPIGPLKLRVDSQTVAEHEICTSLSHFALCDEGLCIGYDSADPVSSMYTSKFEFTGGTIRKVVFDVAEAAAEVVAAVGALVTAGMIEAATADGARATVLAASGEARS